MKKILLLSSLLTVTALAVISTQNPTNASASNPNDGNAGAPMDNAGQTCTSCHSGTATQTTGVISSDIPGSGYIAGVTYNFTVTMSGAAAYGFEITPQTATSNVGLGTLIAGPGTSVSTKYIKHSSKLTGASATWTFQWTAPTATTVTFYGAFNYANNNNNDLGDIIKTSSVTYLANTTGIADINNQLSLSVYPNPTANFLHINSNELFSEGSIYSLDGKLVKTLTENELTSKTIIVSNVNNGIYFLHMTCGEKNLITKFTKND